MLSHPRPSLWSILRIAFGPHDRTLELAVHCGSFVADRSKKKKDRQFGKAANSFLIILMSLNINNATVFARHFSLEGQAGPRVNKAPQILSPTRLDT